MLVSLPLCALLFAYVYPSPPAKLESPGSVTLISCTAPSLNYVNKHVAPEPEPVMFTVPVV